MNQHRVKGKVPLLIESTEMIIIVMMKIIAV